MTDASPTRRLITPQEIQLCYVLRRILINVVLLPTPLALKLVSIAIIVLDTPALVTPFGRVLRIHRVYEQALRLSLVLGEVSEFAERPV